MEVIGLIFVGRGVDGDFNWMIEQDKYRDSLFIFNDNESQYIAHRDDPGDTKGLGCTPGGGNSIIRPYQCLAPPRSAGIPTGPNYDSLKPHIKAIIDDAIKRARDIVATQGYSRIFYSAANTNGELGTGIFQVGEDVKSYIVSQLKSIAN
jgi:hypothetical protein